MKIFTRLVCLMIPVCLHAQSVIIVGELNPLVGGAWTVGYRGEFYESGSEIAPPRSGQGTWTLTGVGTIMSQDDVHCEIQWPVTGGTATLAYSHRNGGMPNMTADPITIVVKVPVKEHELGLNQV